ncbi:MAG: rod shape-determining protein MreC [Chthoniobacterales bacterium]|nr:rod shape-determining protein MreC [Chthoniobacterales bacterium]
MKPLHLVLLAVAAVIAVTVMSFSPSRMKAWQGRFLDVSTPALSAGAAINDRISKLNKGLKTLDELEAENAVLLEQNNELRASGHLLGDLNDENRRLRESLGYRERSAFSLVPAAVVSRDASSWWNSITVSRGFSSKVESSQPVLTAEGLVGRTTTVAKDVSIVLLLTDENCRVAASVEGTNEQGILSGQRVAGSTTPQLVLNFLNRNADLKPGARVLTAGVSGAVFPAGIPLGVVKEFRTRELDGQAIIEPAADFSRLEDVFVVLGKQ